MPFSDKNIVVGVTGCVAAYRTCQLVADLVGMGADVDVVMTKNATEFIMPQTFESLTHNPVTVDTFNRNKKWEVGHVSLAQKAALIMIVPCTANVVGKIANGIADDMLTTTVIATKAPVLIAPAMNTNMYTNTVFQENVAKLKNTGFYFVNPIEGRLACGAVGMGHIADEQVILDEAKNILFEGNLKGKTVLVTAGATEEPIDSVRFITNRSSGRMGVAVMKEALRRCAKVIAIVGRMSVPVSRGVEVVNVNTTDEMYGAVMDNLKRADIIVMAAAPSDYKPDNYSKSKLKDKELTLHLVKNVDIAGEVGKLKGNKKLVVFAAETDDLIKNANKKLIAKNADLVVANDVTKAGAGFDTDTNIATVITKDNKRIDTGLVTKDRLASIIFDSIL